MEDEGRSLGVGFQERASNHSKLLRYLQWIRWFRAYCQQRKLEERAELTLARAQCFIAWYAQASASIIQGQRQPSTGVSPMTL